MNSAKFEHNSQELRIQIRVGSRIRELRWSAGMTSQKLASLAGISQGQLSKIENGKAAISIKSLGRLCSILDRPVSYLFQAEAEMPKVMGTLVTVEGPENKAIRWFADEVARRSDNRINLLPLRATNLGTSNDQVQLLSRGSIDLFIDDLACYSNLEPAFQIFSFPYIFRDMDHQLAFLEGSFFVNNLRPSLKKYAIEFLNTRWNWIRGLEWVLIANRPIRHPDDIRNLRVRTSGWEALERFWKLLGARPVPVLWMELKKALRNGRVDVVPTHKSHLYPLGFCRYLPYVTRLGDVPPVLGIGMHNMKYRAMIPEIQNILKQSSIAAGDYFTNLVEQAENRNEILNIRRYKAKYLTVDIHPWKKAVGKALDRLMEENEIICTVWNYL